MQRTVSLSVQDALCVRILEGLQWPSGQKLNSAAPLLPSMLMSLSTCHQTVERALSKAVTHLPVQVLLDCIAFTVAQLSCGTKVCNLQDAPSHCPALPCPTLPRPVLLPCPVPLYPSCPALFPDTQPPWLSLPYGTLFCSSHHCLALHPLPLYQTYCIVVWWMSLAGKIAKCSRTWPLQPADAKLLSKASRMQLHDTDQGPPSTLSIRTVSNSLCSTDSLNCKVIFNSPSPP